LDQRSWWLKAGAWRHFEFASGRRTHLRIDGQRFVLPRIRGRTLQFRATTGSARFVAVIISPLAERGALLFHRLAELHARVPNAQFPWGTDLGDNIRFGPTWMSGFWAGALWQAAALEPAGGMFARWALAATTDHFGQERSDTHDVGFMYGQSSLAAWRALCPAGAPAQRLLCARLRSSSLSAGDELRALAAGNPGAGTVPTGSGGPVADTIIDSMMNIGILPWASSVTGNAAYSRLASHHAHVVARLLVRSDGSTAQAVYLDRATGKVLSIGTHQGLSGSSTWSRGQAWAVYGFAQTAAQLHDRALLRVAERLATYVARHLPATGIPRWDYDAPNGSLSDVSAGVITAAGLVRLAAACNELRGTCTDTRRWLPLARRMLAASLTRAAYEPPLGLLRAQVLNGRAQGCWCNTGELIFGVTYALEALRHLHDN
jgi:unsaturated chondroitin disaccharide hydrolase